MRTRHDYDDQYGRGVLVCCVGARSWLLDLLALLRLTSVTRLALAEFASVAQAEMLYLA